MSRSAIYAIINGITRQVYVGSSVDVDGRFDTHLRELRQGAHPNDLLQSSWDMYGESAFEFVILERLSPNQLHEREKLWIEECGSTNPVLGFNRMSGGRGYWTHSITTRRKISSAKTGRNRKPFTSGHKASMSRSHKGKTLSSEHRAKISSSLKGRRHSAEHRARISASKNGRSLSAEHREAISDTMKKSSLRYWSGISVEERAKRREISCRNLRLARAKKSKK